MNDPRIQKLALAIQCAWGVGIEQLARRDRHRGIADARIAFCALGMERYGMSSREVSAPIGRTAGNARHTVPRFLAAASTDRTLKSRLDAARRALG